MSVFSLYDSDALSASEETNYFKSVKKRQPEIKLITVCEVYSYYRRSGLNIYLSAYKQFSLLISVFPLLKLFQSNLGRRLLYYFSWIITTAL